MVSLSAEMVINSARVFCSTACSLGSSLLLIHLRSSLLDSVSSSLDDVWSLLGVC